MTENTTTSGPGSDSKQNIVAQAFNIKYELERFWERQQQKVDSMDSSSFRDASHTQDLPLARIKKIMKLDGDVKSQMISAEVPILFAKASEMFIEELTQRAWVHTEENKRKTLHKNDMSMAVAKYDQFDFLIDIVPREEYKPPPVPTTATKNPTNGNRASDGAGNGDVYSRVVSEVAVAGRSEPGVQLCHVNGSLVQAPSQDQQPIQFQITPNRQNGVNTANGSQPIQIQIINPNPAAASTSQVPHFVTTTHHNVNQSNNRVSNVRTITDQQLPQVYQQVVDGDGNIQHIPITLPAQDLHFLKEQFQPEFNSSGQASTSEQIIVTNQEHHDSKHEHRGSPIGSQPNDGRIQQAVLVQGAGVFRKPSGGSQSQSQTRPPTIDTNQVQIIQLASSAPAQQSQAPTGHQIQQQVYVQQRLADGTVVYVPVVETSEAVEQSQNVESNRNS